jgi:hypothetical protein
MAKKSEELNIELVDLQELARINPLAWEQLVHIADNRINAARILDLESHLDQAHEYGKSKEQVSNGKATVTSDA